MNTTDWTNKNGMIGDRDGDGIKDYDEFFITYTNPFEEDTDNDGVSDYGELIMGSNPNVYFDCIQPNLTADFNWYPLNPTTEDFIHFFDISISEKKQISSWLWSFGDGNISNFQHPTHKYAFPGEYNIVLNITEGDNYDTVCKFITISRRVDEELVNQSVFDHGFPIRHVSDGDWSAAQNFSIHSHTLTKVEIFIRKFGTPEYDLAVELRESSPTGPLIENKMFNVSDVPSNWTWLDLNFNATNLSANSTFFIVIPSAPDEITTSFGYEWGYAFGDQYPNGSFWFTRDGGWLWRDLPYMYDFTFRTYGYS